jgi:UDP-2,4-diacetamido-2,4,6-trideoxy-beta-L-altropyranose hydrolase
MLSFRFADKEDLDIYFKWSNEKLTRENSFNSGIIEYQNHVDWFNKKINDSDISMYVFMDEDGVDIGQVRIEICGPAESKISISVDEKMRGVGYASEMIKIASRDYLSKNPGKSISAFIFVNNEASIRSFIKAGYQFLKEVNINNISSFEYTINSK